ncbi:MAG: flagellar motor protein MotB [Nocardioides sp.]
MPRAKRRQHEEEHHGNHERWLVTYADMLTLLMVLFIVMFAISQVDQKRFDELKSGMAAGFGQSSSPFQGENSSVMSQPGAQLVKPVLPTIDGSASDKQNSNQATTTQTVVRTPADALREARAEVAHLEALRKRIHDALAAKGLADDVSMAIDERGLRISLVSRHIVFHNDIADMTARGKQVCDVIAPVLKGLPNSIDVDGHTNQVKVKPKYYPTDWELSAARAVNVLRYLHEKGGVPAEHMQAVAYGHTKPLMDPDLPGAEMLNKRVDIVVLSNAREDARQLFTKVLADQQRL